MRYVIGIDEAGRGALAGPISVGAVLMPEAFDWSEGFSLITRRGEPRLRDSKQLSAQQRDTLYEYIATRASLRHACAFVDAQVIDAIGIVNAAHEAAAIAIGRLGVSPGHARVELDAGLKVPSHWEQASYIRGDETVPVIAFASIVAKVSRDRLMESLPESYAAYHFGEHKGYGTLAHRQVIRKHGLSVLHRTSFCRGLRVVENSV